MIKVVIQIISIHILCTTNKIQDVNKQQFHVEVLLLDDTNLKMATHAVGETSCTIKTEIKKKYL